VLPIFFIIQRHGGSHRNGRSAQPAATFIMGIQPAKENSTTPGKGLITKLNFSN